MKKLKENWKTILVAFIALLVVIFGIIKLSIKYEEKELEKAKAILTEKQIASRVKSELEKAHIFEIDSLKSENLKEISELKKLILYHKKIAQNLKVSENFAKQKSDSLLKLLPQCSEIAKIYQNENDSLRKENAQLDSINFVVDLEAQKYSENLYLCEKQNKILKAENERKDTLINSQQNYIFSIENRKKQPNFWSGLKVGFASGFVIGFTYAIAIKN